MINLLKNILNNQSSTKDIEENKSLELLCGLMIEAAYTDGQIDEIETNKIKSNLLHTFCWGSNEVELVLKALKNKNNSNSLYHYTSFINKIFRCKKLLLIEALWEIVLSDGDVLMQRSNFGGDLLDCYIFLMWTLEMQERSR